MSSNRSAALLLTVPALLVSAAVPAHAGDGFRAARGETKQAIVKIATKRGLKGRYAVLVGSHSSGRFGVACGTSGGKYGGFVPVRRVDRRWRFYDPSSGGLQTYAAACERRL